MLIPEKTPEADLIMVATGTGIAPYRTFVRRLFVEDTPARKAFKGLAWLFLGVANTDSLLYDDEWQAVKKEYPNNFRVDYALSREQNNKSGGKMCTSSPPTHPPTYLPVSSLHVLQQLVRTACFPRTHAPIASSTSFEPPTSPLSPNQPTHPPTPLQTSRTRWRSSHRRVD